MTTANIFDLADTWNDGATTFTAIKMDVTDTASAAGSLLMDLQVGGETKLQVNKDGRVTVGEFDSFGGTGTRIGSGSFSVRDALAPSGPFFNVRRSFDGSTNVLRVGIGYGAQLLLSTGTPTPSNSNGVVLLRSGGSGILAQRDRTLSQTFNIYNTYTDASNFERARLGWAGNAFEIKPQAEGTGTVRTLHISGLPTSDPAINGVLWNDAGTVKVSAG